MANLIIHDLTGEVRTEDAYNGEEISVAAPCDCSAVTGVQINGTVYPFYDALGHSVGSVADLFSSGSIIRLLIDTTNTRAQILNAGDVSAVHYKLSIGTTIPSNSDLNDYSTPGTFACANATSAQSMTNAPTGLEGGFELIVIVLGNGACIRQQLKVQGATCLDWERYYNGTWGAWVKSYDTQNKPTPAEIGAAESTHTHTPASIGAAASSHTQAASTINAGTLNGKVLANASAQTSLSTAQLRNATVSTTDLVAGTSNLATGTLYFVYE